MVQEPLTVEIYGKTAPFGQTTIQTMRQNQDDLVTAVSQDNFTLTVTTGSTSWK